MLSGRRGSRKRRRGATLVEFAVVVPVVFVFMFGLIELSRYVMVQQALTSAAQRGCRKAMLATTLDGQTVETVVRDCLDGSLGSVANSTSLRIGVSPTDLSTITSGSEVSVRVEVNTSDISWVRGNAFGRSADIMLVGQSTLVRE